MDYYLMVKGDWALTADAVCWFLAERWPGVRFERVESSRSSHCLEFEIPIAGTRLRGSLHRKGNAIIFLGDMPECAEFVLWFRSVVPASIPLFLCDENVSDRVELTDTSTREDVLRALKYAPQR
jgi:hypothetical protein